MNQSMVWLIILLVVGVVVSNLMVLKYTSKFKWPSNKKPDETDSPGDKNSDNSADD